MSAAEGARQLDIKAGYESASFVLSNYPNRCTLPLPDFDEAAWRLLDEHHLLPAAAHMLGEECSIEIQRKNRQVRGKLLAIEAALAEVLCALGNASVPTISLKGPVLAERLHDDSLRRPCADLDLLIAPEKLDSATAVLETLGWAAATGQESRLQKGAHHHMTFVGRDPCTIDLHTALSRGTFGKNWEAENALRRRTPYAWREGGQTVAVLSPEEEFLYLCMHALGHGLQKLGWLLDLKLYREKIPLDAEELLQTAESLGYARALRFMDWLLWKAGYVTGPLFSFPERQARLLLRLVPGFGIQNPTHKHAPERFLLLVLLSDRWPDAVRMGRAKAWALGGLLTHRFLSRK